MTGILLAATLWLAADPPLCTAARDGVQMCMTNQVCTCAHDSAGALTGRSPGWRWSCDILMQCDADAPASADPPQPAWPGPLYVSPGMMPPRLP